SGAGLGTLADRCHLVLVAQPGYRRGAILSGRSQYLDKQTRMRNTFLDFEQPLAELESKIEQLRFVQSDSAVDISDEISRLQQKNTALAKSIYAKLTPWQTALVARHPQRPYTLDYVREIFTDFHELHGDRMY